MKTDLNKIVYKILTFCSIGSISLFTLGLLLFMLHPDSSEEEVYSNFTINMMWQNSTFTLLFIGILILIAAPIIVTVISAIVYTLNSQYRLAVIPFLVLLVIISSLILGITGIICPKA